MEPRLEIRHLRLLEAVAEEGGVTRAGARLHLTQSAMSHQLRDAEQRLGTPLFLRAKRRMVLTAAGERVLASARRVLADLQKAEAEVRGVAEGSWGRIRFCTECYTCYHWLPSLLKRFQKRFPRIEVTIDVESTPRAVAAVLDGRIDVAIVSSEPRDPRLRLQPLFEDELVAIMARDHRLARRSYLRPADFEAETLFVYPPVEESMVVQRLLLPAGVSLRAVRTVQLTEAIVEMVRGGLGIAVLARWAMAPYLERGALVGRRVTAGGFRRRWEAATLAAAPAPPALEAFIELVAERSLPVRRAQAT